MYPSKCVCIHASVPQWPSLGVCYWYEAPMTTIISRGGSSFSVRGGLKFYKKNILPQRGQGARPGEFFKFSKVLSCDLDIFGNVSHSVYHQIIRKPQNKVIIFFIPLPLHLKGVKRPAPGNFFHFQRFSHAILIYSALFLTQYITKS